MLSIIVPCLNEAPVIADTLAALSPLRSRGAEVIIVDGGSRDGTPELAAPLADLVITAPRGRASQMNAGASRSRGEILLFLYANTALPEAADGLIIEGLQRSRRGWGRFDVTLAGRHPLRHMVGALMNVGSRLTGIATGSQAIFVTRSLFTAADGYPEGALREDIALSRRLKRFGRPLCLRHRLITSVRH